MKTQRFELLSSQSNIAWTGRKVTGAHNGTIGITEGFLDLKDGILVGGSFTIDTTSIKILDITDPATNAQFAGHLASDDFFSSTKYPNAEFEILTASQKHGSVYEISGNLTIKGITNLVSFEASLTLNGQTLVATGKIVIDRTQFDIKFRSGNFFQNLGDTLIYNEFDLNVNITAKAVSSAVLA
jgi:polyisoprenoid-binding protein YceI